MHRISHNFDDETPTPLSMSKNSSFDSAFVTMTKFVEYSSGSSGGTSSTLKEFHSTNQQWAQYSKILHPSIVQKMNQSKSASDYVKELYALMGWNVNNKSGTFHAETIKKNVKTILKTMEEISLLFSVGSFQDVSVLMTTATTTTTTTTTSSMNLSNSSGSSSGSNNTNDSSTMSATMTQFFHILLSLLSTVDDKKLVELIHVFVCEMNLSELERNQLLSTLKKQFSMFNIINRMHCVKTVDRLISSHLNNNNSTNNNSNNTKNNNSSNNSNKNAKNMNSNTNTSSSSSSSHQTTMIETLYTFIKQVFEEYGKPDSFAEKKGLSSLLNVGFSKEKINKLNLLKTSVKMIQRPYMIQYLISNHHILSSTTTATTTATPATKSSKSSQQQTSSFIIDSLLNVSRNKDLVCARESIAALSCIACELSSNIQTSHLSNIVLDAMSRWIPKYSISVHPPGVHIAVSASSSSSAIPSVGGASVMGGSSSSGGGGGGGIGGASASASGVVSFAYSHTEPAKKSDLKKATLLPYLNTDDVYSRYHLCQMSALVVKTLNLPSLSSSSSSKKQYDDNSSSAQVSNDDEKYSDLLKYLIHDENLVVFFEAIKHISLRNFSFFIQKDMNQQSAQTILDFVVKRLCNSLAKHKSQTQIHAACKASEHLLMSYAKFVTYCSIDPYSSHPPESPEMKQCAASLLRLYDSIDELTTFDCCFVRLQAFKAILWRQESLESTLKLLKMEVKSNMTWTPFHIHELMLTLLKFSRVQFAVFEHFADFACFLCIYLSERLDLDLLIALLRAVVPSRDAPKRNQIASKFLRMMFHILDNCLTGSKESVQLSLTLYAFLGDIANKVTGEPRDERDNVAPQSQQQKQMMDPKQIFQRPEMFDIQNGAMKAIIIRLTHNCMYNNPQVRTVCTEALAKIAFRSQGSVRLFIYEVFQYLAQIPALGLGAQALGMIQVLNEVYQLQQQLVKLLYKQPSDVETLDFFEAHEQLKKKIAFFTRIPPSYMIVGRASQALLAKGHHLKFNSRK